MDNDKRAKIVDRMWHAWCAGDLQTALDCLSDDIVWIIPGSRDISGRRNGKAAIRELFAEVRALFPNGLEAPFHKVHTTEDSVVVEMTNKGTAANGKWYENEYCIVFQIPKDKIEQVRVYVDMSRVAEMLDQ
jgi:uncharacterized protein (TIGR02246 family)